MSPMRSVRAFQNVQSGLSSASNSPRGTPVRTFYNRNQQSTVVSSSQNQSYYGDTESKYSRWVIMSSKVMLWPTKNEENCYANISGKLNLYWSKLYNYKNTYVLC